MKSGMFLFVLSLLIYALANSINQISLFRNEGIVWEKDIRERYFKILCKIGKGKKLPCFGFGKKGMFRKNEIMCKKLMFWEIVRSLTIWDDTWIS